MASIPTASIDSINPNFASGEGYELSDQSIIPNADITATFTPFQDIVEIWAYDFNNNLIGGSNNFLDYTLIDSPTDGEPNGNTSELSVNPENDLFNLGFDQGAINVVYNFIQYKLASNNEIKYYISEISSDRTELRLKSNFIDSNQIKDSYFAFKSELDANIYFDEFYLNFGDNEYQVCVNCQLDISTEEPSVLIKLYDALPLEFVEKDEVCVVIKPAESLAYSVTFPELEIPENFTYIKGPNYNLKINDFTNNSTNLQSQNDLLKTNSSGSSNELQNILNRKGITLTPNYSYDTFNEFVNFSSAKKRIENFVEKVTQIQSYQADIDSLNLILGPTSESFTVSSSIATSYQKIESLVKNFDGYEYFLYYGTGSSSYPKTGSAYPYELLPTSNPTVSVWLGNDQENGENYGGILLSASLYDNNNQNWLYYTIPEFIRDNNDNNQYLEFSNMVGQHFDEIWLYTRAVTEKLNTTSQLDDGVPLDLADDVITSLGYTGFGNNFNNQDNFIGLVGEDNGSYVPPTGSELITNYIAVNNGQVVNYWNPDYSWANYVAQLEEPGFPYAIDKVSKEIYKRLYHNMNYLVKKKGTIAGLRQLINIWGIPNTILRINEFGGKDRDNSDDYDLWYNRYSYAYTPVSTQNLASSSVVFPWMPLERNRIAEGENIVPDNFQFRFKTTGYPSSNYVGEFFTQSLAVKKSDGDDTSTDFDFGISLFYEPPVTGSYSGSASSEYENWGKMRFYMSGSTAEGGVATSNDIYLPFFDKGWWTVMLQRNQHVPTSDNTNVTTYTLYAKNTISNGFDGAQIGFEGSASISSDKSSPGLPISESINEAWNKFGITAADGIYLGGFISGSVVGGETIGLSGKIFSGSLQEFRYYSNDIPEATFNDFVMNPESIEGNAVTGSERSFDIVNFRAPLGNEMESMFTSSYSSSYSESMQSMHPAIQGQASLLITGSFYNPTTSTTSSEYRVLYYENSTTRTFSKTNTEVYFLDQPAIGFRNRISDKIQLRDGDDYGNILSNRISIQQDYQISRSYTENINNLEVAFSPQDEVNDDIIASFGYGVIATAIADPRFISSSDSYYPKLREIAESYFEKYTEGNVYDYLRLIKYFDNSIFKAIKAYVPARTSLSTGIVIKQHMLERNRFQPVQITEGTPIAVTPSGSINTPIILENIVISGSIDTINQEAPSGSTGGSANKFNYVDSSFLVESGTDIDTPSKTPFGKISNTQSYEITNETVLGAVVETIDNQHEFYDGEYSGSELIVTTQSLFNNPFLSPSTTVIKYNTDVYNLDPTSSNHFALIGPEYWDTIVGTDVPTGSFALGYAYVPSSSLITTTASFNDFNTQTGTTYSGSDALSMFQTDFYTNYQPTPFISASNMNDDNSPLIVGFWRSRWGDQLYLYGDYTQYPTPLDEPYPFESVQSNPFIPGILNPATQSLFPTYVGLPSSGSTSDNFTNGVGMQQYINSNTVAGAGTSAIKNPTPSSQNWPYLYTHNPATPGFRLDLTSLFPISSSFSTRYQDSFYGGLDFRIVDSVTFFSRNSNPLVIQNYGTALGKNFGTYTFLFHGSSVEDLFNTRPIQQYGEVPGLDRLAISGSGGGATYVFATATTMSGTITYSLCSTNEYIAWDGDIEGTPTSGGQIAMGMDVYNYNGGNPIALPEGFYAKLTGNGNWGEFANSLGGVLNSKDTFYIDEFSATLGAQILVPSPNNNFPQITSSWDVQTSMPGATSATRYDVMAIDGQSYSGGTPSIGDKVSNRYLIYNFFASQQRGNTDILTFPPPIGSSSLYTFPVSYTASLPEVSTPVNSKFYYSTNNTIVTALSINDFSINQLDITDTIDNSLAFDENPNITFALDYTGSVVSSGPPPGNVFDLSLAVSSSRPNIEGVNTYLFSPLSRQNIGKPNFNLSSTNTVYNIDPYIANTGIGFFENTVYYAIPNNFNENRPNKFKFVIENQNGINTTSNLTAIANSTAPNVQTPESNYTQLSSIIPKFSGSKLTSANYNTYSPPTSPLLVESVEFANGTSGSWGGDDSYGKVAAIDKNPIYFAHFKSSKNNLELDGTYTFTIDQLIESPLNDITQDSLSVSPKTIEINGSNNKLIDVVNTFEKGRKASITYQVQIQTYPVLSIPYTAPGDALVQEVAITQSVTTNYQTLKIGDNKIFQSGLEFETLLSTQPDGVGPNFLTSASMTIGQNVSITPRVSNSGSVNGKETISYLGTAFPISAAPEQVGHGYWAFASGSTSTGGYIDLKGGAASLSASLAPGGDPSTGIYSGDFLAMAHSYNYWVEDQLLSEFTASATTAIDKFGVPGLPTSSTDQRGIQVLNTNLLNYNSFNFSSSETGANILGYTDFNLPFLVKRGDEIRVTYDINFTGSSFIDVTKETLKTANYRTQDFTVTNVGASDYANDDIPSFYYIDGTTTASISESRLFDRLFVTPNPAELEELIPSGSIYQFTIRRRTNADDRVIIYQTPPINALGSQTPSGDGFLIPNDFTQIQKNNVQTLINQLKSQNAVNSDSVAVNSQNIGPSSS